MADYKGGLAKKLAEVTQATSWVEKRGKAPDSIGGYQYAMAVDIYATVRKALADRNIAQTVGVNEVHHEAKGDGGNILTTITGDLSFIDGDTGEVISVPFAGAGMDKGDKGLYKAITGGVRDALKANFLLPTGSDPEAESPEDETGKSTRQQPAQQASPTAPKPPAAEKVETFEMSREQRGKLEAGMKRRGIESPAQRKMFVMSVSGKHSSKQMTSADLDKAFAELEDADSEAVSNALAVV